MTGMGKLRKRVSVIRQHVLHDKNVKPFVHECRIKSDVALQL